MGDNIPPKILRAVTSDEEDIDCELIALGNNNLIAIEFDPSIVRVPIEQAALAEAIVDFMGKRGVKLKPADALENLTEHPEGGKGFLGFELENMAQLKELGEVKRTERWPGLNKMEEVSESWAILKLKDELMELLTAAANDLYTGFTPNKKPT